MQKTDSPNEPEGWTVMLFVICVVVTTGTVLPIGYCFGVVNTPAEFIKNWLKANIKERFQKDMHEDHLRTLMSAFVSTFVVGGIVGSFFGSKLSEKCGRKGSLIIASILNVIGAVCMFCCRMARLAELLLVGRFICGIAAALVFTSQPTYLVELAPAKLSGSVGVFTCIGVTGGVVVGQIFSLSEVFGTEQHWHVAVAGFVFFVVVAALAILTFPESPRYIYMSKGDVAKTKAALAQVRRREESVNDEVAQMVEQSNVAGEKLSMRAVLRDSKFCLPLTLVCTFHVTQQLSGINAIFYYSMIVYRRAGYCKDTASWLNFILGLQNFLAAMTGPTLMSKLNRRCMMLSSCALCCLSLIILTDEHRAMSKICILCLTMYVLCFNVGLASIPYFIGAELCEVAPRATVMAFGSLANWISNLIIGMSFPELQASIKSFAFLPCAIVCVFGFLFTYFYLPETRNREATEVAPLIANGLKSKPNEKVK